MKLDIPIPKVGQRIRLKRDFNSFPACVIPKRSRGTVVYVNEDSRTIHVKLDKHFPELDYWGNCIIWNDWEHENGFMFPYIVNFHEDCQYIKQETIEIQVKVPVPRLGQKVRFLREVDRAHEVIIAKGAIGTIVEVEDSYITVQVKKRDLHEFSDDENEYITWSDEGMHHNGFHIHFMLEFHDDVEYA